MLSRLYSLCFLCALAWLARDARSYAATRARDGRILSRSSYAWAAPFWFFEALACAWGLAGFIEGTFTFLVAPAVAALIAAAGACALRRDDVWGRILTLPPAIRRRVRIAHSALILLFCVLTVELPYNARIPLLASSYFWLEALLMGLLLAALYYMGARQAVACLPALAFFFVTGIGQHFVRRFKNAAILPTDLLVLNTAAAVTKEYVFSFNEQTLLGLAAVSLALLSLALVEPTAPADTAPSRRKTLLKGLACAAALVFLLFVPSYMGLFGVQMQYWYSIEYYSRQGFFPSFIAVWQDMPIRKPAGYSANEAGKLTESYAARYRTQAKDDTARRAAAAQFQRIKPSVVIVMNESFADLSLYDGMHAGYEGPQFFRTGFSDALALGTLNVSVHGAGTCNTEFELLTGNALCFVGAGKYPYSIYDLSHVDALAQEFDTWGYATCAIHPNYATNWNRHKVYPQMGFDRFLSIDDFGAMANMATDTQTPNEPHCEVFHSGVSDKATYDRILQMLKEDDTPQFFFDVTMANHGSYSQSNIPAAYQCSYLPQDYQGEETPERLNEYLGCIAKSDDDLREFVGELRNLDRPVVLVFFGDHQPSLSMSYNDWWYTDEPEDVHARRAYSTDYVVWANYDVAGREQRGKRDETSVDMLAALTLDLIGAPLSDFQAAQLAVRADIPSLSAEGYQGADRSWYGPDETGPYADTYRDLARMEYHNFAERI